MTSLEPEMVEYTRDLASVPRPLTEYCRKCIRTSMGKQTNLPKIVDKLKLPTSIKNFILFGDLDID
jgi:hypothetical protein